jgi:hypothetical protein
MRPDQLRFDVSDDETAAALRALTPDQRLQTAEGLWHLARDLIWDKLRHDHPDWNNQDVDAETARRMASGSD